MSGDSEFLKNGANAPKPGFVQIVLDFKFTTSFVWRQLRERYQIIRAAVQLVVASQDYNFRLHQFDNLYCRLPYRFQSYIRLGGVQVSFVLATAWSSTSSNYIIYSRALSLCPLLLPWVDGNEMMRCNLDQGRNRMYHRFRLPSYHSHPPCIVQLMTLLSITGVILVVQYTRFAMSNP
jgi:hypothetical protein